jgi:uncharacterized RDD family membrane protein YckC/Tfp pilus assembly major pilin PilA
VSEPKWYYLDADRKQTGPVTADIIRSALQAGSIAESTLVWRDGMSEWRPIAQLAGELGISPTAPSPPSSSPSDANTDASFAYRPPNSRLESTRVVAGDVVPAGFLRRWAALFLDSFIVAIPAGILAVVAAVPLGMSSSNKESVGPMAQGLYYLFHFLIAPLYYAGMESSARQATLGKQALGIKVTDDDGRRLSFGHALGRWFAAALSYMTLYVGFLMAAFTERKRALHDIVAGTLVVDKWAYTEFPERQKREVSGCLIAILIGLLIVPVMAILAAIAISQYQDYVVRSQVSEASALADGMKTAVAEYRINHESFPTSNGEAGLPEPSSISGAYVSRVDVGGVPGEITATFSAQSPQRATKAIDGASLVFSPTDNNGVVEWHCHSESLKRKWCSRTCDCQH